MGRRNSVHCESIEKFIRFLEVLGVSKNIINEILRFHYSDGTIDGTGKTRQSVVEYKRDNEDSINLINSELAKRHIITAAINRFMVQGIQNRANKIDLLLYGIPIDFFFVTPNELHKYMQKKINVKSTTVYIANFTLQPLSRVLNCDHKREYMRN